MPIGSPRSPRRIALSLTAVTAMAASFVIAAAAPAAAAPAASQSGKASNVIVVLRDQHTNLSISKGHPNSPRNKAYRDDQTPLIGRARNLGAKNLHGFSTVNAVAATVTPSEQTALAADPTVAAVYPDLPVKAAPPAAQDAPAMPTAGPPAPVQVQSGSLCPSNPGDPLLEPEALQITNTAFSDSSTPQAQNIVDGTGVTVAFIADGLDIDNQDFMRNGHSVFTDYQDFSGDGTAAPTGSAEAFGDASAIAAQGRVSYDLADYVNPAHPLPPGCTIRIRGMAPGANLMGLKVFGQEATAPTSRFIEAIDYAVAHGADVLNESFGANPYPDTGTDPISLADAAAIAAGVTVVASTGDSGVNGTVGSPASADIGIIGVGATTQFRSYLQQDYSGARDFSQGTWVDNNISGLSSGGIAQANRTPDLVAPGDLGWALCTADTSLYTECTDDNGDPSAIQDFGGTSQSSPLTAGAAALVIEAYRSTHHGDNPAPAVVKQILTGTATDLGHPAYEQGAGELNSLKAVQAAESWRDGNGHPTPTGSALVVDKTQLGVAGYPSSGFAQTLRVTNVGTATQRVTASTRTLGRTVSDTSGSVPLNTATSPAYLDAFGIYRSYATVHFTVGENVDRVTMYAAGDTAPRASRIILIDPAGVYSAYSIPQGSANYAMADVRYPAAGTWTAYLAVTQSAFDEDGNPLPAFDGVLQWRVLQQDFTTDGRVSPSSFSLRPGASRTVTVYGRLPSAPGDVSASVQLTGSASGVTSVPMSLRAVVPPRNTSFSGTLLGGNGRGFFAEANVYYLDVPRHQRNLGVGVRLQDSGQVVMATLTAPNGQTYSWNSNAADGTGIQDYVDGPMAGRWVLTLEAITPSSGAFTQSAYRVTVAYNSVRVTARSLPTSTRTKLARGRAVTVPVTITNTGAAALTYFADARLDRTGTLQLANVGSDDTFPLPEPADQNPLWLLPTHTSSMTVTADGHGQPVNLDVFWQGGNPDVYSAAPGSGPTSVTASASQLSQSYWAADMGQTGPFDDSGAPAGTVTVSATAVGQLFDTDVTTSTDDYWLQGLVDQSANAPVQLAPILQRVLARHHGQSGNPAPPVVEGPPTLAPGQSATILVTITPSAHRGTRVQGHLYVDTFDGYSGDADELIDLPYAYTVG